MKTLKLFFCIILIISGCNEESFIPVLVIVKDYFVPKYGNEILVFKELNSSIIDTVQLSKIEFKKEAPERSKDFHEIIQYKLKSRLYGPYEIYLKAEEIDKTLVLGYDSQNNKSFGPFTLLLYIENNSLKNSSNTGNSIIIIDSLTNYKDHQVIGVADVNSNNVLYFAKDEGLIGYDINENLFRILK